MCEMSDTAHHTGRGRAGDSPPGMLSQLYAWRAAPNHGLLKQLLEEVHVAMPKGISRAQKCSATIGFQLFLNFAVFHTMEIL